MPKIKEQFLLAHRGFSTNAPENTALAFDLANLFGFDGIEIDVHLTKDNELVVIHDENTQRTGLVSYQIIQTDYHTLTKVDVGKFSKIPVPFQKILTLKEFLDKYLNLDNFKLINIEIKTDVFAYKGIEKLIYQLVSKYDKAKEKIIFSSFNFKSLEILAELDSELKLGFLFWTKTQLKSVNQEKLKKICYFLHPWNEIYDKNFQMILAYKKPLIIWTVKSQIKFNQYKQDPNIFAQISNYKF